MTQQSILGLEVLQTLDAHLSEIGPAQVEIAGLHLNPPEPEDNPIGEVTDLTTRRIYALARVLAARGAQANANTVLAGSVAESEELERDAEKFQHLSKACAQLFWLQVQSAFDHWKGGVFGLRLGWQVVEAKDQNPIRRMLGLGSED